MGTSNKYDCIQSDNAQEIATLVIHYTRMVDQYNQFLNTEFEGEPLTPESIRDYFKAEKVFLECTKEEAVVQYWLVGFDSVTGIPTTLQGGTIGYTIPRTYGEYDNCIPIPDEGMDAFDFTGYDYQIVEVEIEETT